jgi:hypothetical protein
MMAFLFIQCAKQDLAPGMDANQSLSPDRKAQMKQLMALAGAKGQERASLRSSNTYTISEALDLLDETLNYAYCRPATPQRNTLLLSDTLMMPISTSSMVSEEDLADLFDAASLDIGTQYHALTLNNKQPWVFSVNLFGEPVSGEIPIIVQMEVAYGAYITDSIGYSVNVDYSYAWQGGLCDATPGPGAPEVLRDNLKYDYVTFHQPSSKQYLKKPIYFWVCNTPYSDIEICSADGLPDNLFKSEGTLGLLNQAISFDPANWSNINDWKLFRQSSDVTVNYDECLSGDEEMPFNEYHMGGYLEFVQANWLPSNYLPVNIWVGSNKVVTNLFAEVPFHNMIVCYARVVQVSSNDEPIELPCTDCN